MRINIQFQIHHGILYLPRAKDTHNAMSSDFVSDYRLGARNPSTKLLTSYSYIA